MSLFYLCIYPHCNIFFWHKSKVGQNPPEVGKDPHWDIGIPEELPYTVAALPFRIPNMETAAENLKIPIEQHRVVAASEMEEVEGAALQMASVTII